MKIYDCFTFYNELDLLEIRLKELYDHVDHFVLVEASRTFQNREKPYIYFENKKRYAQWNDKIIYVQVNNMPDGDDAWSRETHQRNQIVQGLQNADENDIVIISDCDEIIRHEVIDSLKHSQELVFPLRMPLFNFKFNYMRISPGHYEVWAMAVRKAIIDQVTPDQIRNSRFNYSGWQINSNTTDTKMIEHAGWHFSYLGDIEYLKDKAKSFSHTEVNRPDFFEQLDPEASIRERKEWDRSQSASYEIVALNDYFPAEIYSNKEKYSQFILEGHVPPTDFLPR